MNDIGAMNNVMGMGAARAQMRSPAPTDNTAAAGTPAAPNSGNAPAQMPSADQLSISSDAYRLQQSQAAQSTSGETMDAGRAQAMLQSVQSAMAQNPQAALAAQAGQLNPQRVASLLN
ncbi:hypothetical protein GWK36_09960 [Caldichromatium japonicum]|uniref:Uncharacterized protein n=1 Tax=Caldichromatium japonicum TaxID=2699430 RepID=A0A6G7VEG8_9GAMM|nr:hypothetical protein [Caldichromatium japonicum]QIK38248.1 hypothetical protein GWK36_09960 [Caldichromatium japonicum]